MGSASRVRPHVIVLAVLLALGARTSALPESRASTALSSPCTIAGKLVPVPGLREGSGIAASRSRPGVLWAHNDSAHPVLVVLNEAGAATGQVRVTGARVDDWEDIAVGPCAQGWCIYIGDIGDNNTRRPTITVYRVPEPAAADSATRQTEVFNARYPDGAHDAEALFVTDEPRIFIVTKGDGGPVALYRFPAALRTGVVMDLERVGAPAAAKADADNRPTAADVSRDGRWVAIRTTKYVAFHQATDLLSGKWIEAFRTEVSSLREPRGEGITFGPNGAIFLVGEAGTSRAGTFARLDCKLPS